MHALVRHGQRLVEGSRGETPSGGRVFHRVGARLGRRASRRRATRRAHGPAASLLAAPGVALLVALAVALLSLLAPPRAEARYERRSTSPVTVGRVEIAGNEAFSRKRVLSYLPSLRGSLFHSARYREAELLSDIDKLVAAYRAAGYLDVWVAPPEVTFPAGSRRAIVTIRISEGLRTFAGPIAIEGNTLIETKRLEEDRFLRPGAPFDRTLLPSDAYRIYALYADLGRTYARVTYDTTRAARDSLAVLFRIDEGEEARVGEIRLSGNERTLGRAIRRELRIREGDPFSREKILESQARLYGTGLFTTVEFEPDSAAFAARAREVPLTVRVHERKVRWFGFGVGYGTTDFARISADWNNRNVLGTGRQAEVRLVSSRLFAAQRENYRGEATFTEPWLLNTRTRLSVSLFHDRRDVENFEITKGEKKGTKIARYRLHETGLRTNVSREVTRQVRTWVGFNLSWADAKAPSEPVEEDVLRPERKRSLDGTLERIARDNLFDPRRGSLERLYAEYAGGAFGGDSEFLRLRGSAAVYHPFWLGSVVAARVDAGQLWPQAGPGALPDHERFRVGGATTVRGYGEEEVGPGNFLLLTNVEWRIPIVWHLSTALFLDGGNAWGSWRDLKRDDFRLRADEDEVRGGDYRYGAGVGLRLATPVGPARLDWARKLKEAPGESPWGLHLSLGQPF